jgi:cytochrome c-type biogenesis protein CcmH/NrfG
MLRYIVTFPTEARITQEAMHAFQQMLSEAADAREWRDVIVAHGCTVQDVRQRPRPRFRYSEPRPR